MGKRFTKDLIKGDSKFLYGHISIDNNHDELKELLLYYYNFCEERE